MPRPSARQPDVAAPGTDDLERLLEAERRLEALVRRAREDAQGLVRGGRDRAAARAREERVAVATAMSEAERQAAADTERAATEIRAAAAREVTRLTDVSDAQIDSLAAQLLARLLVAREDP